MQNNFLLLLYLYLLLLRYEFYLLNISLLQLTTIRVGLLTLFNWVSLFLQTTRVMYSLTSGITCTLRLLILLEVKCTSLVLAFTILLDT